MLLRATNRLVTEARNGPEEDTDHTTKEVLG